MFQLALAAVGFIVCDRSCSRAIFVWVGVGKEKILSARFVS